MPDYPLPEGDVAAGMLRRYSSPRVAADMALDHAMDYPEGDPRHDRWMRIHRLIRDASKGRAGSRADEALRRGKATDAAFAAARACTIHRTSLPSHADMMRGDSRTLRWEEACSIPDARRAFDADRRATMSRRPDGTHAFRIASTGDVYVLS